jgi:hypothetical protein
MLLLVAACTTVGCGGSDNSTPGPGPSPTPTPTPTPGGTTITITANGAAPRTLTVPVGSRVTFVNNDNRPHEMNSDPHPEHTECPAINDVGFITQGQSRATGNLTTVRTCRFHDHNQPTNTALQGTIVIQ